MSVIHITKDNFDAEVLHAQKPVLLDFWASWCGPCRIVAPVVEQIAEEYDSVTVGKVNVDDEMALATQFGITSIPTLIVMENGQATGQLIGFRPKEDILKLLGL